MKKTCSCGHFFANGFPFLFPTEEKSKEDETSQDKGLRIEVPDDNDTSSEATHTDKKEPKRLDTTGKKLLVLERTHLGEDYTHGRLIWEGKEIAKTLEGPSPSPSIPEKGAIPEGDYPLALRQEGGQHTTYHFRFGQWHSGMIHIQDVPGLPFAYLLVGNEASLSYGNVLVGEAFHEEYLLRSEEGYKGMYEKLVGELADGGEMVLRVKE